jgi:hypothetical protein
MGAAGVSTRQRWLCTVAGAGLLALAACLGLVRLPAQQGSFSLPAIDPPGTAAKQGPAQNGQTLSAANANLQTGSQSAEKNQPGVALECAQLLRMATDLKTEVDKTNQDTLSVTVVRKAGAIEELAKKVKTGSGKS